MPAHLLSLVTPLQGYTMSLVSLVPPDPKTGVVDPVLAGHVVVGAAIMGLAFSDDDGASWRQLSTADGSLPVNVSAPWRFLRTPNGTAFAAVTYGGGAQGHGGTDGGVWRVDAPTPSAWSDPLLWKWIDITPVSSDWGYWGFWGLVDMPLGFDGGLLVVSPSAPNMFTSTDGGASWALRNTSLSYNQPCWQPAQGQPQSITFGRNNIVVTSRNPGVWLMSTGFGVASSTDLGDNWGSASRGIGETVTFRCHSHPSRANWTFCGVGDLTGFIITDGGVSGIGIAAFHEQPHYWASDFGHGAAWAGGDGLVFPGGTQLNGCLGQWITWPSPGAAPLAVTAGVNTSGVLRGVPLQFVGVQQAPDNPLDLLLLTSSSDYSGRFYSWNHSNLSTYSGGIVRSVDGGSSWSHITAQPPSGWVGTVWDDFPQLSLDGGDVDTRWWALAESGLFVSRDRGETWARLNALACSESKSFYASVVPDFRRGAGAVFVLTSCGSLGSSLLRTSDYGATFSPVGNFTVPSSTAWPLASHASGRLAMLAFAAGSPTAHVWVTTDVTSEPPVWISVDAVERGHYLGTGVSGLEWDAVNPDVLYISTNGHGVIVVALQVAPAAASVAFSGFQSDY